MVPPTSRVFDTDLDAAPCPRLPVRGLWAWPILNRTYNQKLWMAELSWPAYALLGIKRLRDNRPWERRCHPILTVAEVLPVLYLRRLSTGDFRPALRSLLGEDAAGLSATNISRLTRPKVRLIAMWHLSPQKATRT